MARLTTEGLGQLHRLVDDHPIGDVGAPKQLPSAQPQDGALHRIHQLQIPVQAGGQFIVQRMVMLHDAMDELPEIVDIYAVHGVICDELLAYLANLLAGHLPLVDGLNRPAARPAPLPAHCSSRRSRFTISMAESAASPPLLPALVPARSMACSMVSTVSTPNATGIPVR